MNSEPRYEDEDIKHLSPKEHILLRKNMYIGRSGDGSNYEDFCYIFLKEVIDNSVDEHLMGKCDRIEINVDLKTKLIKVKDNGRGIPLNKLIDAVSETNTSGKFNTEAFTFSVGLNGLGTKLVNFMSQHFLIKSVRDGNYREATFADGDLKEDKTGKTKEQNGTYVEFIPSFKEFPKYKYNMDFIKTRIKNYIYLNAGLTIVLNGEEFLSKNGLLDLANDTAPKPLLFDPIYFKSDKLEFVISYSNEYSDKYESFVNSARTTEGGTHLTYAKTGLTKGINSTFGKQYNGSDIRDGLYFAVSIKVKDPQFESQTKIRLSNTTDIQWVVTEVASQIESYLRKNQETAKALEAKILFNESLRTQLNDVKKSAKEASKRTSLRIEKLKDCKYHKGESKQETMIFLTEGDSAGGTMTPVRDVTHQAIFMLRGKPENMYGMKKADIYKNKELYNLMSTLGIENSIDDLRYDKIVIASDQDDDGLHIRNLLLTFFLTFFPDLVNKGFLYILETPLFKLEQKEKRLFAYSNKERDDLLAKNKGNWEITRAKGLGEWNSLEMKTFIHPDTIKLNKISLNPKSNIEKILRLYEGPNSPERKELILQHLHEVKDIEV
jgi:topoisomerase-4 subunit B